VVLPGATWLEKTGSFQNIHDRLQLFEQAIEPIDGTRPEGQIALDLMNLAAGRPRCNFALDPTHAELGANFLNDLHRPASDRSRETQMEYAEF